MLIFFYISKSILVYIPLSNECFNSTFVFAPYNSFIRIDLEITEKHVEDIKAKMHELSKRNLKIEKLTTNRKEAIKYYESSKEQEKVDIYSFIICKC